jgi:protein-tyrosine phosphatase
MGTVHGVYLKYVGLSALSYAAFSYLLLSRDDDDDDDDDGAGVGLGSLSEVVSSLSRGLLSSVVADGAVGTEAAARHPPHPPLPPLWRTGLALLAGYSCVVNGVVAALFKLEIGTGMIGKDRQTGRIPPWSRIVFFPFHCPTALYTWIHTRVMVRGGRTVPVATEVRPGWWIGGCYAHELDGGRKTWACVIDLTVEFPETCIDRTSRYLSLPTWDGVPPSPERLEEAANFAVAAWGGSSATSHRGGGDGGGDVLIHCAHGRGRSATVAAACLVRAGLFPTWRSAFEEGIRPARPVCRLNRRMRRALTEWQERYVDGAASGGEEEDDDDNVVREKKEQ